MQYNGIFYIKKNNNIRNSITEISNIMTEKYFSLVNVNVIFNIIFFDYVAASVISSSDTLGGEGAVI